MEKDFIFNKPLKKKGIDPALKKNILIGIAIAAGLLLLAALGVFLYFKAQFIVYQDDQYKFSIKYPKDWKVVVHPQATVAVVFLRPKDTALDTVQENLNVTIQDLPGDISTLDAFSTRLEKQMIGVFGKSIHVIEDKPLHWGWRQGHEIVIEAPTPDHLEMVCAWGLRSNQTFIMTFLGDMNKYGKDKFIVDEMIHSLQIME